MNVVMKRIQNIETSKSSVLIKICDAGIIIEDCEGKVNIVSTPAMGGGEWLKP